MACITTLAWAEWSTNLSVFFKLKNIYIYRFLIKEGDEENWPYFVKTQKVDSTQFEV